jgi:tRNA(Ile)-lysidine synthase
MTISFATLETALTAAWPAENWRDVNVLVAVSGGADSVALLRALVSVKHEKGGAGMLFVGHLDHGLRADSAGDAAWVAELCGRLAVPCEIGVANVAALAVDQGDGVEGAARDARYEFLRDTAEQVGARYVATAHTQDDQVETVLHRVLRGTGLSGLAGMPKSRPLSPSVTLVRPLVTVSRVQVLEYLQRIGQDFRDDHTNSEDRFTRNRIRRQLLPLLRSEFNPDVDAAMLRLATQADEAQQVIAELARKLLADCVAVSVGRFEIERAPLALHSPHLIREVCKLGWQAAELPMQSMGFDEWSRLAELIVGGMSMSLNLPSDVTARRQGDRIVIARNS